MFKLGMGLNSYRVERKYTHICIFFNKLQYIDGYIDKQKDKKNIQIVNLILKHRKKILCKKKYILYVFKNALYKKLNNNVFFYKYKR